MIKIYGSARSSAARCFLILEELGLPYEVIALDMMQKKEHKSESFLKLNPNGKVPCLVDGDFVIWESLAINYYLCAKHRPELLGQTPEEKGHIEQWSLWGLNELQAPMVQILIQMLFVPEEKRDLEVIRKSHDKLPDLFKILERTIKGRTYIVGDKITLADFNLASVVNIAPSLKIPLDAYPALQTWLERIRSRPSFQKFVEKRIG